MGYVFITLFTAVMVIAGGTSAWLVRYHRRVTRQPEPYELHRSRWERTGDITELEAMTKEIGKEQE